MSEKRSFFRAFQQNCPLFTRVALLLLPFAVLVHILASNIPAVADWFTEYPASAWRFLTAKITGIFPFSVAELLILLLPVLFVLLVGIALSLLRRNDVRRVRRFLFGLVGVLLYVYISFVMTLGTGYHTSTIDKKLGLDKQNVSADELYDTAKWLESEAAVLAGEIPFDEEGGAVMPYSLKELNDKLNAAYDACADDYPFLTHMSSRVKPIALSEPMSHTHISGVYSFPTGEANLVTVFPDHSLPSTMAHEMAHQRGISREDEANFMAFLIAISSEDPFIRYSGYLEIYKHVINALASADRTRYNRLWKEMDPRLAGDIRAYNRFFDTHPSGPASNLSSAVNDFYQHMQGVEAGVKSYGLVVDLAVAYGKQLS